MNSLPTTQQEMMAKLATIEDGTASLKQNETSDLNNQPKLETKKKESRKWKNWSWKHSPNPASKHNSIEEEPDSSPKKSNSSKHSSPAESPKHKMLSNPSSKPD